MSGRARGRGVARGRGNLAAAAGQSAAVRRPGSSSQKPPQQPPTSGLPTGGPPTGGPPTSGPPTSGPPTGGPPASAGRASQRGGARGESRPGVTGMPVTQMAQMSLGTQDAQRRSRHETSYTEPNTKPAHITNKKGEVGTDSKPQMVVANYFKVRPTDDWILHQYHVDFNPPIDSRSVRKGLLKTQAQRLFGEVSFLFDGMQLYSPLKLPNETTEFVAERRDDNSPIRVIIKHITELMSSSPVCVQIMNIHLRQNLSDLGMKEVQRSYFSPQNKIQLPNHRLEVWPGYKTSILQFEDSLLLNVDVSHKVLRTETVLDFLYNLRHHIDRGSFHDASFRALVGEIVVTRYNDRTYRIDDIDWDSNPRSTFPRNGTEISYIDYYRNFHGITVRDEGQPLLISRPKKRDQRPGAPETFSLLPELCLMTGLTDDMRKNFTVMKDLAVHTRVEPSKRSKDLMKFMSQLKGNQTIQRRLASWRVDYGDSLVEVQGRVFNPENILLGPDGRDTQAKKVSAGVEAEWSRALRGKMLTSVNLDNWLLVYFEKHDGSVNEFYQSLQRVAPPLGMNVNPPKRVVLKSPQTTAFLQALRQHIQPSLQMVVCILPSNRKDMYDAIKTLCCHEKPVPSQCVTFNILKKPKGLMSVVTKIAIQINCKMGGEPWAVSIPLQDLMVVGIDTYHDSAKKGRSRGGFVASLNKSLTRYYSQTTEQTSMQELSDQLTSCMTGLEKYKSINGVLPKRVVVYRDGVGDGQLSAVYEHEMPQVKEAFRFVGSDYRPELVFIVVKKRINSRFFKRVQNGMMNPGPGSVVDSVVTRPEWYDYFLISQSVRQGTVTPTHYNVIHDTSTNLSPARIQRLTYKLCHLYYNWPGTIRVPAPCQYAHKLAFLVGQSIHKHPDLSLADKLYYL